MAPAPGNKNRVELKDPAIRQEAYKQYCDHIAAGNSKKSWFFDHPDHSLTWETMEKYIKDEIEFDPVQKKIAECKALREWEGVCMDSAKGKNKDANTASLQMVMRNKFGWDREDKNKIEVSPEMASTYDKLMGQIAQARLAQETS